MKITDLNVGIFTADGQDPHPWDLEQMLNNSGPGTVSLSRCDVPSGQTSADVATLTHTTPCRRRLGVFLNSWGAGLNSAVVDLRVPGTVQSFWLPSRASDLGFPRQRTFDGSGVRGF